MNKNKLIVVGLFILILVGVAGYWFGYQTGSAHRFIPYSATTRLAFDSKSGQVCRTVPPSTLNDLLISGGCSNPPTAFDEPHCSEIVKDYPSNTDHTPQCKNLR
jgi:hypothetical protein